MEPTLIELEEIFRNEEENKVLPKVELKVTVFPVQKAEKNMTDLEKLFQQFYKEKNTVIEPNLQ